MSVLKKSVLVFLLLLTLPAYAAVYDHARFVSVLSTDYFDIMFSKESAYTAQLIADNADVFYEQACAEMHLEKKFRIPIVITPDSDELSVSYSASPYNRIVVYDAVPGADSAWYGNSLLKQLDREIIRAVSVSIRSPFWQAVASFLAIDSLQPVYLLNMPFSFVEGACATMSDRDGAELLDDTRSLQLLTQAKIEKKFPTWMQVSGARDIYPGSALAQAAGSAFAAYLQQRFGIAKYVEYWRASGSVYLFALTAGIFYRVYGISLRQVWSDFEDAIPVPENQDLMTSVPATPLFPHDQSGLAKYLVSGAYGTIWYDDARHEVDLLTPESQQKPLFFATGVTRLSLSSDGQYLAVSLLADSFRTQFKKQQVRIYNIPMHSFMEESYPLREGSIFLNADGMLCVAGIYSAGQYSELRVYEVARGAESAPLLSRAFPENVVPYATVSPRNGTVACLVVCDRTTELLSFQISDGAERIWTMPYTVLGMQQSGDSLLFSFIPETPGALVRAGIISFADDGSIASVSVQTDDISGGMYDPALSGDSWLFCAHKANWFEISRITCTDVPFTEVPVFESDAALPQFAADSLPVIEKQKVPDKKGKLRNKKFLGDYQLNWYNPFPYMFRGTWIPMLPLSSFSFDGYMLAPGLGVTYLTQSDPIDSTEGVLSFSSAFADPATNYQTFNKDYSFSAYVKNTSLPVDVGAGGQWQISPEGQYQCQVLGSAHWRMPLAMNYQNLSFTAQELWTCSSSYKDTGAGTTVSLPAWTSLNDAFYDNRFSIGALYKTYRQSGISAYEQFGFEVGATAVIDYDYYKPKYDSNGTMIPSLMNFVIDLGLKLPRIIPLPDVYPFVLGLPLTAHSEWYGESGTSCDTYGEVLLLGWESQFGIPVLNVYLTRMGISAGYDFKLKYSSITTEIPDIRNMDAYFNAIGSATWNDYVYLTAGGVFSPVVGFLTKLQVTAGAQLQYYFRTNEFKVAALISAKM